MVGKLASMAYTRSPDLDENSLGRDEIRQVIVDTVILCESDNPHLTLESWLDDGA